MLQAVQAQKNENKTFQKKVKDNLKKQNLSAYYTQIEQVKKENSALKEEIKIEQRGFSLQNKSISLKMNTIQNEGQVYAKKLEEETIRNIDLTDQINKFELLINQQAKSEMKKNESKEVAQLIKKVKGYEYKLDQTKQKHNNAVAEIKRLKEEVNLVRRERVIFDNVFKKLEMDLKLKEEELKKYLRETIQIENDRSNILEDLQNVKESTTNQKDNFLNQYEHLFQDQKKNNLKGSQQFKNQNSHHDTEKLNTHNKHYDDKITSSKIQNSPNQSSNIQKSIRSKEQQEVLFFLLVFYL